MFSFTKLCNTTVQIQATETRGVINHHKSKKEVNHHVNRKWLTAPMMMAMPHGPGA
jgi:hypothetical protein